MKRRSFFAAIAALCVSPTLPAAESVDVGIMTLCGGEPCTLYVGTIESESEWYPIGDTGYWQARRSPPGASTASARQAA